MDATTTTNDDRTLVLEDLGLVLEASNDREARYRTVRFFALQDDGERRAAGRPCDFVTSYYLSNLNRFMTTAERHEGFRLPHSRAVVPFETWRDSVAGWLTAMGR